MDCTAYYWEEGREKRENNFWTQHDSLFYGIGLFNATFMTVSVESDVPNVLLFGSLASI